MEQAASFREEPNERITNELKSKSKSRSWSTPPLLSGLTMSCNSFYSLLFVVTVLQSLTLTFLLIICIHCEYIAKHTTPPDQRERLCDQRERSCDQRERSHDQKESMSQTTITGHIIGTKYLQDAHND